ncbi:ubiquinol oxidase subunit II [Buchnera aphidicola]|uniref:ubiquinol oxidase subunit II n=1 Tax=Buchnera aphidicola TaxID=9 RepID=UPI00346393C2
MLSFIKRNFFKIIISIFGMFVLSGCHDSIFHPSGQISIQQYKIIFVSFLIMMIIVIPVILMTILFVYKYRDSNKNSPYSPDWSHSNKIEFFTWFIPILIICILGTISYKSTYALDPKKSIISRNAPIEINVVSLDWKWLFIYPHKNIATINEIVFPINTPIIFHITSNSVMSSFFIPSLGSQIYAMPGMKTTLNLISSFPEKYYGFASNYNGIGFSNMKFSVLVVPNNHIFNVWVQKIQKSPNILNDIYQFHNISDQNIFFGIRYFSHVCPQLFDMIVHRSL